MRAAVLVWFGVAGCDLVFPLEPPPIDAPVISDVAIDAPFIPCPTSYDSVDGQPSTSYHFVLTQLPWRDAETACEADDLQHRITHLAVPDDLIELADLQNAFSAGGIQGQTVWIGVARGRTDPDTASAYFAITGKAIDSSLWEPGQPSPSGPVEKAAVTLNQVQRLVNQPFLDLHAFICECDQQPASRNFGF